MLVLRGHLLFFNAVDRCAWSFALKKNALAGTWCLKVSVLLSVGKALNVCRARPVVRQTI